MGEFECRFIIMLRLLSGFLLVLVVGASHGFILTEDIGAPRNVGIFIPGRCPEYTTMADFDVTQYVGRWFESSKFETFFELGQKSIKVVNSGVYIINNEPHSLTGNATATHVSGSFDLYFPGAPMGKYNVLKTDYKHYTTIYYCQQIGGLTFQTAWILARELPLSEEYEQEALKVFEGFNIDTSHLNKTIQGGDCTY